MATPGSVSLLAVPDRGIRHNERVPAETEAPRVVAGRYRLRSVLGSGSMGTVWAAYDEFLQRPVAVKEIRVPPGVTAGQADELRERTLREARAIAVLSHPNVIVLHDVARENGEPFVVMELLTSHSLAELIREHGPLTVEQAAAVAEAVAAALEAAHAAGITHRDVKPGNVLVGDDGRIKLTDFGIARNVSEATMTRTGMTLGSPAYMAPEVASGKSVTPAADLWGLGATLFHALEGRPPYDADDDPMETMGKVVKGEVPQPTPGRLSHIITALMAKEPRDRMPLREVRRQVYPLLTKAPRILFSPEMFARAKGHRGDATDTREMSPAPSPDATGSGNGSQQLAADPGPLPFTPSSSSSLSLGSSPSLGSSQSSQPSLASRPEPAQSVPSGAAVASGQAPASRPAARSTRTTAIIFTVAAVLFLLAASGGFVAARVIGAEPVTPPHQGTTAGPAEPPQTQFERRSGDASNVKGGQGGKFSVEVPSDWTRFSAAGVGDGLPPSTLVEWVSPDGSQMLAVDHIAGFFPAHSIDEYLGGLQASRGSGSFTKVSTTPLTGREGVETVYRTFDTATPGGGAKISRSTFAQIFRDGRDLWAVSVTAPTAQEDSAKTELYDRMLPTFEIAG